jgi:hypothetical protein
MRFIKSIYTVLLVLPFALVAQEQTDTVAAPTKSKLERAAFESSSLIEAQTNVLNTKGTLQLTMNHRFGIVNSGPGANDMLGLWAPANIRLELNYGITDRINVGFATVKDSRLQDFTLKGALLRQTKDGKMPFSLTYYGNATYDARHADNFVNSTDKWSFFSELILAKRFSRTVSLQLTSSISHFNYVEAPIKSDLFAMGLGGRIKVTPTSALLLDYNQPVTNYEHNLSKPGMGVGFEFSTGSHAFQLFITNYRALSPQHNVLTNQTNFFDGKYMIGFNITRLWHM